MCFIGDLMNLLLPFDKLESDDADLRARFSEYIASVNTLIKYN